MENVIVLERPIEEALIRPKIINIKKDCNPGIELKKIETYHKRSRVKFYRPEPYPVARGLLVGF